MMRFVYMSAGKNMMHDVLLESGKNVLVHCAEETMPRKTLLVWGKCLAHRSRHDAVPQWSSVERVWS